jgi:hypothetical protein
VDPVPGPLLRKSGSAGNGTLSSGTSRLLVIITMLSFTNYHISNLIYICILLKIFVLIIKGSIIKRIKWVREKWLITWVGKPDGRRSLGNLCVDGRIILKCLKNIHDNVD